MEVVLASHSNLAKGMYETVSLIMGKQEKLHYLTAYVNGEDDFSDQFKKIVAPIAEQQIIFVTDLLGGSVNSQLMRKAEKNANYLLVAGMNLPFVIELVNFIANQKVELATVRKKLPALIAVGQKGLQVVEFSGTAEEDEF